MSDEKAFRMLRFQEIKGFAVPGAVQDMWKLRLQDFGSSSFLTPVFMCFWNCGCLGLYGFGVWRIRASGP